MTFAADLERFKLKVDAKADRVVEAVVAYAVQEIDARSPVGNPARWKHPERAPPGYVGGRFRGNWQLGIDHLDTTTSEKVDPAGTVTVSAALAKIPEKAGGHVYYYANSLPYAQALEYGHSTLAPSPGGIVGLTLIDARNFVDQIARDTA